MKTVLFSFFIALTLLILGAYLKIVGHTMLGNIGLIAGMAALFLFVRALVKIVRPINGKVQ